MANDEILEGAELEENIIVLTDDEGNEVEFEFVDLIEMDEKELLLEANKWELSHGGLSGRTAEQFINYVRAGG